MRGWCDDLETGQNLVFYLARHNLAGQRPRDIDGSRRNPVAAMPQTVNPIGLHRWPRRPALRLLRSLGPNKPAGLTIPVLRVQSAIGQEVVMPTTLDRCGLCRARRSGPFRTGPTTGVRWQAPFCRPSPDEAPPGSKPPLWNPRRW